MKNRKREICTSGSVRDEDGQPPHLLGQKTALLDLPTLGRTEIPHPPSDGTATLSAGLLRRTRALVALGTHDIVF
jgi:hypothetical protein